MLEWGKKWGCVLNLISLWVFKKLTRECTRKKDFPTPVLSSCCSTSTYWLHRLSFKFHDLFLIGLHITHLLLPRNHCLPQASTILLVLGEWPGLNTLFLPDSVTYICRTEGAPSASFSSLWLLTLPHTAENYRQERQPEHTQRGSQNPANMVCANANILQWSKLFQWGLSQDSLIWSFLVFFCIIM